MLRFHLSITLVLAACAADAMPVDFDPFEGLSGKADGASFEQIDWLLTGEGDELTIEGDGREARYKDVEHREHRGAESRIRLDNGDRFAGMRSFLMVDADWDVLSRLYRRANHMGLPAPRVARARWIQDGVDHGTVALVEHVGDRFLNDHFDSGGVVVREADVQRAYFETALRQDLSALRAIEEDFTPDSIGAAIAFSQMEGEGAPITFVNLDDGRLVAALEVGASWPEGVMQLALRSPRVRKDYEDAMEAAVDCFDDEDCDPNPIRFAEMLQEQTRREGGDAPTGSAFYRHHVLGGAIEVRFRHLTPDHYATTVDVLWQSERISMVYDEDDDLWKASVTVPADITEYTIEVLHYDGSTHEETRSLNPALDELTEIGRYDIDVNEPSGLAFFEGGLLTVGDERNDVIFLDLEGTVVDEVEVGVRGMEGVAVDLLRGELLVTDEDRGDIVRLSFEGDELERSHFEWADEQAGGIEGLTIDSNTGDVYFAKEASPSRIAVMDEYGEEFIRERVNFADDVSALTLDASEHVLYALSDRERSLYRLSFDFEVEAQWEIDVVKPEGLVVQDGRVYVVSDIDAELVVFDLVR